MIYLGEIRTNWRYLVASSLGLAVGYNLSLYISNIFAPHLLKAFGWSEAQFALLGLSILVGIVAIPTAGRLTDILGVRPVITFGVIATPLIFAALSQTNGSFTVFFLLNMAQVAVGATTTSLVYSRIIALHFSRSRGLALALAACAAPATGALVAHLLSDTIDIHGWRFGYLVIAASTLAGGIVTLLLLPREMAVEHGERTRQAATRHVYRDVLKSRAFRRIAAGMFLCNLMIGVLSSQVKIILIARGASSDFATTLLSIYAIGIVAGRLSCGLMLDRFATHLVSALSLGLPCAGLFILGVGVHDQMLATLAVFTLGLSMGAELDVLSFLTIRFFDPKLYSTVYGVLQPVLSISAATGSLLLSSTLKLTGSFQPFLFTASAATLVGGLLFVALGRFPSALHAWKEPQNN